MRHRCNSKLNEVEECRENNKPVVSGLGDFGALAQPFCIWTITVGRALVGDAAGHRLFAYS